jgi:S-adenosylmethionine/arginine decarboxylase-like enzyme
MMEYNGCHMMIDARLYESNSPALRDAKYVDTLLRRIVDEIEMTMIFPPCTAYFPSAFSEMHKWLKSLEQEGLADSKTAEEIRFNIKHRVEQTSGYSTYLMIAESHISMHTFPTEDYFSFDCYSCKGFDTEKVVSLLKEIYGDGVYDIKIVPRLIPKLGKDDDPQGTLPLA